MRGTTNFNLFWTGRTLSAFGDAFGLIAMPLVVLQATGSVVQMGLVSAIAGLGQIVGSAVGGAVADRMSRRGLMIFADVGRALLYALIPAVWFVSGPNVPLLCVVVAAAAFLGGVFAVASTAALVSLVPAKQLTSANGKLQASIALSFILGPGLAGLFCARFGAPATVGVNAMSFVCSGLAISYLRIRKTLDAAPANAELDGWLAGAKFLWRHPVLRTSVFVRGTVALATVAIVDLFVFHLKHNLLRSDTTVGIVLGCAAIGGLTGSLSASFLRSRIGFGASWIVSLSLGGLALFAAGYTESVVLLLIFGIVFLFGDVLTGVLQRSLWQQVTPDRLLGRVAAASWILMVGPGALGAAGFAALGHEIGIPSTFMVMGMVVLATALVTALSSLRHRAPEELVLHRRPDASEALAPTLIAVSPGELSK